jgi:CheY-like chemotaxis protein
VGVDAELVHHLDQAPAADLVAGRQRVEVAHHLDRLAHVGTHDLDQGLVDLLAFIVEQAGFVPIVATNPETALQLFDKENPLVAVIDLNMPDLDGVETAIRLRALQPSLRIALHSSDPEQLRKRAAGLQLPLFDKFDFNKLLEWVEQQARDPRAAGEGDVRLAPSAREADLCCSRCSYGIASRTPPARCPMCGRDASWIEPRGRRSRRTAVREGLAS